jgi:hypothetical protein
MEKNWDYRRCVEILEAELAKLQKIEAVQASVRRAVLNHEWADFDWKIAEINQLGREFAELDAERTALFADLQRREALPGAGLSAAGPSARTPPFYTLSARLPADQRRELSSLYRAIKMETLKSKTLNDSFLNYLLEAKNTAAAYLDAVFPARGGKLYTRKGAQSGRDLKSMVINSHI